MLISFIIYIRAIGFYLLFTLPLIIMPLLYFVSALYVLFYGWFAWALFTIIYHISGQSKTYGIRMLILVLGVLASVCFAFHMLQVLGVEEAVWNSGGYLLVPLIAVIAGWVSLYMSAREIRVKFDMQEWQPEPIIEPGRDGNPQ